MKHTCAYVVFFFTWYSVSQMGDHVIDAYVPSGLEMSMFSVSSLDLSVMG